MSTEQSPAFNQQHVDMEKVYQWINELSHPETKENALLELSKKREVVPDLAPMLWHSFGTTASLMLEIVKIYPAINPPSLNAHQSNRVCNALALLQCVASHPETRSDFLKAQVPLYLYPFLHTVSKTRPFEYLRLTSLGVIGALVKTDESEVITFLISTEIIPLCLRIMESGSELSKTVATFILQKILLDETGLSYICQTYERFSHVAMVLGKMVISLTKDPSARLLKHVVRCYLRLSDNPRAREALRQCLPDQLRDSTFTHCLQDDKSTNYWLTQLLKNLEPVASTSGEAKNIGRFYLKYWRETRSILKLSNLAMDPNARIQSQGSAVQHILQLINDLSGETTRGSALEGLMKYRDSVPDLGVYLWYSFGTATSLLMEVISVYTDLCCDSLNVYQINRLCKVLSLLQCVADHSETRVEFAKSQVPYYLVPFLRINTIRCRSLEYENLRLMTLGVFGSWIKSGDHDVIRFMLSSDFIPYLLAILKTDKGLSKTVACFILQNILANQEGLDFLCHTYERFSHVATSLNLVVKSLSNQPSARLLKYTLRCYRTLVNCERACQALQNIFPSELRDPTFYQLNGLHNDRPTLQWLQEIIQKLDNPVWGLMY